MEGILVEEAETDNGEEGEVAERDVEQCLFLRILFGFLVVDAGIVSRDVADNGIDDVEVFHADNEDANEDAGA